MPVSITRPAQCHLRRGHSSPDPDDSFTPPTASTRGRAGLEGINWLTTGLTGMVPLTRRRLLGGTAALFAGLAGCSGSSTTDSNTGTPPAGANVAHDPERHALRTVDERPPVWLPPEGAGATDAASGDATAGRPDRVRAFVLVASEATARRLRFADVDGADEARAFATATDFDAETLYLDNHSVEACRRLELCHVAWSDTDVDTQYGGYYRDADVSCDADARHAVSWLIRIPDALDPDAVTSRGSGWSSQGCRRRRLERDDGTATDAPDLGPATNATRTTAGDDA